MEIRKNFDTFKKGDVVRLKRGHPFINKELLCDEIYVIDKMLSVAGVVTLVGQEWNKTFPDDAFELVDNGVIDGEETQGY